MQLRRLTIHDYQFLFWRLCLRGPERCTLAQNQLAAAIHWSRLPFSAEPLRLFVLLTSGPNLTTAEVEQLTATLQTMLHAQSELCLDVRIRTESRWLDSLQLDVVVLCEPPPQLSPPLPNPPAVLQQRLTGT